MEKIVSSMKLKISARDSRHTNPKVLLFAICSQWLPLAEAVLSMSVDHLSSPLQLTDERVERLMCRPSQSFQSLPHETQMLKQGKCMSGGSLCDRCCCLADFLSCGTADSSAVIVFITKLFVMDRQTLPQHQTRFRGGRGWLNWGWIEGGGDCYYMVP